MSELLEHFVVTWIKKKKKLSSKINALLRIISTSIHKVNDFVVFVIFVVYFHDSLKVRSSVDINVCQHLSSHIPLSGRTLAAHRRYDLRQQDGYNPKTNKKKTTITILE